MKVLTLPLSLALALIVCLQAQTTQGLISGRVTGGDGNPIAGAEILYESSATNTRGAGHSGLQGYFVLPLLPPGQYRLRVTARGYQPQEIHELELAVAAFLDVPFRLRDLNDVWEEGQYRMLVVPGSRAVLNFYGPDVDMSKSVSLEGPKITRGGLESTISEVINPAQIEELPLAGRDVYTALVLQPNVTADTATARGLGLSANGQRPSASNFLLDGLENNNYLVSGPLSTVAPEAIQEYRVSTNNFSAEYGRAAGYIANAVTKAGSDHWHGVGYFNLKNELLNGNDFSRNTAGLARGPLKEDQPGFQVGGPLLGNRLYASVALDLVRSRSKDQALEFNLPSTDFLARLKSFPADNQARKLLTQYAPPPFSAPRGDSLAHVTMSPPLSLDRTVALARLDYLARGGAERIMARVAVSRLSRPDFLWSPYPAFSSGLDLNATGLGVAVVSVISPALTNEARAGVSGDLLQFNRAHPEIPTLFTTRDNTLGGNESVLLPGSQAAYSYRNHSRNWEIVDDLIWSKGRHIFKFGGGLLLRSLDGYLTFARDGYYAFDAFSLFTVDLPSLAFVTLSRQAPAQIPDFNREYRYNQFHLFAQDSFRIARNLVLNYGLRYESFGAPVNVGRVKDAVVALGGGAPLAERLAGARVEFPASRDQRLYGSGNNNWGPRFGFSYSPFPHRSTLIRGAYGIFFDRPFDNLWQNLRNNNWTLTTLFPQGEVKYLNPIAGVIKTLPAGIPDENFSRLTLYQPGIRTPYVHSFFTGMQHQLRSDLVLEANASASFGRKLIATDIINREFSRPGIDDPFESRFQPALQRIYYRSNQGDSNYTALSLLARYRVQRTQLQVAYTWSHTIDNQSEPLFGDYFNLSFTAGQSAGNRPLSTFSRQFDSRGDRGNSDFDQRHNLVFYSTTDLPGFLSSGKATPLFRNWRIALIGAIRSGLPYTVIGPEEGAILNNRATLLTGPSAALVNVPVPGGRQLLNPEAFAPAPAGAVGNLGRNSFSGPGFFNVDLSLARSFGLRWLGEAGRVTLRADAYNVMNHANLGNPNSFLGAPGFGTATFGRQEVSSGFPGISPLRETARQVQVLFQIDF